MAEKRPLVAEKRNYLVTTVAQAKEITCNWLQEMELQNVTGLGLPEVDDRHHIWRVPLLNMAGSKIGEVVIDAYTTDLLPHKTTSPQMLEARRLKKEQALEKRRLRVFLTPFQRSETLSGREMRWNFRRDACSIG